MIRKVSLLAVILAGVWGLGISAAQAADSWTFTSNCTGGTGTGNWGDTCTDSTGTLTAEGFSNTGSSGTLQTAHAQLYGGAGIGVNNRNIYGGAGEAVYTAPNHAIDNQDNVDSLLLSISGGNTNTLTSLTFGWIGSANSPCYYCGTYGGTIDAFDLLAYAGTGTPNLTPAGGLSYSDLLSNGWELVGQYTIPGQYSSIAVNTGSKSNGNLLNKVATSSYWLVTADTSLFNGTPVDSRNCSATATTGYYSYGCSYFKVAGAAGIYTPPPKTPPPGKTVPEPASVALLGIGAFMMARVRSRRRD